MSFKHPRLEPLAKGYQVLEPYSVCFNVKTEKGGLARFRVTVPAGFVTDLASVPRLLWAIVPRDGLYNGAAVVHDFLYQHRGNPQVPLCAPEACQIGTALERLSLRGYVPVSDDIKLTRKQCDEAFLYLMLDAGVTIGLAHTMYRSVRLFGWTAW